MTSANNPASPGLAFLVRNRQPVGYVLIGFAVAMLALAIWIGFAYQWELLSVAVPVALLGLIAGGGGLWQLRREEKPAREPDLARTLVLAMGGLCGLVVSLLGLVLAYRWWTVYLLTWLQAGEGKDLWRLLVVLLCFFGGLAVMFLSLQLGRTEERTNPELRRLIYGYNAVLTGILFLAVLALANVLIYLKMPHTVDFTAASLFSMAPQSEKIIRALDQPVLVEVILRGGEGALPPQLASLLSNCQALNPQFKWERISPDLQPAKYEALFKKYQGTLEGEGLLVIYGPEGKETARFIRASDLITVSGNQVFGNRPDERATQLFQGESLLVGQIDALEQGKKPVVYFTQGNGELELDDVGGGDADRSAGQLKDMLEKRNWEVKKLTFTPAESKVPDDADAVVLAGPRRGLPPFAVTALEAYVRPTEAGKQPGKLVVLLNAPATAAEEKQQTGLVEFLSRFQVQALKDRLLSLAFYQQVGDGLRCLVVANQGQADNPLVRAFVEESFEMQNVRTFDPGAPRPDRPSNYRAAPLLLALPGQGLVLETDLDADANQDLADLIKNPKKPPDRLRPVPGQRPPVVALAVSSTDSQDPHAGMRGETGKSKPAVVVIGDAMMVSNRLLNSPFARTNFGFFSGSLDWLRGRESSIGIPPKQSAYYAIKPNVSEWDITMLPTLFMLVGIVGLGTGVWVIRRR